MEQIITTFPTKTAARRVLEELAIAGSYNITSFNDVAAIYSKDDNTAKLFMRKEGDQKYAIVKETIPKP